MANWNDPQSRGDFNSRTGFGVSPSLNGTGGAVRDQGLRSYMLSIYNYMASGVLLSGIVALLFAQSGMARGLVSTPLWWVIAIAPLGFILAMNFGFGRMRTSTLQALYWAFCTVMGLSLSVILMAFTAQSVAGAFFASAGAFAGLSLVGYTTKRDLSAFGTFLIMGLFGILIASLINIFLHSSGLAFAINVLGVLIFAGLTAWDTQRLKTMYWQVAGTPYAGKMVVMGALSLYLDFINLFQFMLSFMGDRR